MIGRFVQGAPTRGIIQLQGRSRLSSSTTTLGNNPYAILGIKQGSDFKVVKQAFLQAAMQYHPDLKDDKCDEQFIRIRQAFEQIVNKDDESNIFVNDKDLEPYFRHHTREFLAFDMDESTRKEVISVYENMSRGGNDKGGYWDMARQLAEREAARGTDDDKETPLLATSRNSTQRRRRKR